VLKTFYTMKSCYKSTGYLVKIFGFLPAYRVCKVA